MTPRRDRLPVLLFFIGLALYLPGIWWGTPLATAPDRVKPWGSDELAPLGPIAELHNVFIARRPPFNPQYPLLHYAFQAAVVGPYLAWLAVCGEFVPGPVTYPFGFRDPATALAVMTVLARLVNALMGAAVPVIAFYTARRLWDRTTGWIAGAMVLLSYPMFYYARTSNVDMGALFWTALGLYVFAGCLREGLTLRRAIWLGVFAALATATKDASYAAFAGMGAALVVLEFRSATAVKMRCAAAGMGVAALAYAVSSGAIFHWGRYWSHVQFVTHGSPQGRGHFYFSTPPTVAGYLSLAWQTGGHLVEAIGVAAILLACAGVVIAISKDRRALWLLLPALLTWAGVVLPVRFVLFRFVVVAAYVFALLAAFGLAALLTSPSRSVARCAWVVACLAFLWPAARAADLTYQMIRDSRYTAAEWFREHAHRGDRVGYYADPLKLPRFDYGITTVPMPGQTVRLPFPVDERARPEFIVVAPVQAHEKDFEFSMPERLYRSLLDGSMGYRRAAVLSSPSLFQKRVIPFVNPAVQIFVRDDRWTEMLSHRQARRLESSN